MPCTQSYFFSLLPPIITLARELRDSDAHETSAVVELTERLYQVGLHMSYHDGGVVLVGDPPLSLDILEGAPGDADRKRTPVHLDSKGSAKLVTGLMLLGTVCHLQGPAPSGTVQDAIGLLTDVAHTHAKRCRDAERAEGDITSGYDGAPTVADMAPGLDPEDFALGRATVTRATLGSRAVGEQSGQQAGRALAQVDVACKVCRDRGCNRCTPGSRVDGRNSRR